MDATTLGRVLLMFGLVLAGLGLLLVLAGRIPLIGQLPGDISIERGNWRFYFPIATSIVLSIILTIALNLFLRR